MPAMIPETSLPPIIIFHGTADFVIASESVSAFVEKAMSPGADESTHHSCQDRSHEFYNYGTGYRRDYKDTLKKAAELLETLAWL